MRLTENPFLVRAFALGFRSGPGSFRVGVFGLVLAAILGGLFLFWSLGSLSTDDAASMAFWMLCYFMGIAFVFGGFQRMLMSFAQERERGTLDFIHLSTLPPRQIIWGLLIAGQIPGYILLVVVFPILVALSLYLEYPLHYLLLLVVALVGVIVALSLVMLNVGFWSKRASVKGSAPTIVVAVLMFVSVSALNISAGQVAGVGSLSPLLGVSAVIDLYQRATGRPGMQVEIFGVWSPIYVASLFMLLVPIVVSYRSLARCLRYREKRAISNGEAAAVWIWWLVIFSGTYLFTSYPYPTTVKLLAFCFGSWILSAAITGWSTTFLIRMRHGLISSGGSWNKFWFVAEGPPHLVIASSVVLALTGCIVLTQMSDRTLPAYTPLLFAPYLLLELLLVSYCKWLPTRSRGAVWVFRLMVMLIPLFSMVPYFGSSQWEWDSVTMVVGGFTLLSPFSQMLVACGDGPSVYDPDRARQITWAWQGLMIVMNIWMIRRHRKAMLSACAGVSDNGGELVV